MNARNTAIETVKISKTVFDKIQNLKLPQESIEDFIARIIEKADEDIIGIDEVAKILHVAKGTIYQYTHKHLIPFWKPGKQLIFSRAAIMAHASRRHFLSNEDMRNEAARLVAR